MDYNENYEVKGLLDTVISFNSTEQLQAYIDEQIEHFSKLRSETFHNEVHAINTIDDHLKRVKPHIDWVVNAIKSNSPVPPQNSNNVQAHLNALASHWLPMDHPIFGRMEEIFEEYGASGAQAFWTTAIGGYQQPPNHNALMGMLNAYDYLNQRKAITEVSSTECDFIEQHYASAIQKGNELEAERKSLNNRISLWEKGRQESWEKWEKTCDEEWASLTKDKKSEWEVDKAQLNKEHEELLASSNKKLGELEATYQEHLKLEKPAEYWSNMAKKYDDSSSLWFGVLVLLILTGVAGFAHFYSLYLTGQDTGVTLDTVKGIVLFVSGITIYGFLIRVVSRMLMSATHLKRDSQERAQLTYFYLALIKDGAIDEQSRDIVIQSLFSRTETGLITGDSSPTMPAMDVLKNIKIGN